MPDASTLCCAGGERILTVFETRLTQSIKSLDFTKMLESSNVSPTSASVPPAGLLQTGAFGPLKHAPLLRPFSTLMQYAAV